MKKYLRKIFVVVSAPIIVLIIWELLHQAHVFDPSLMPGPRDVLKTFFKIIFTGNILLDIVHTLIKMFIGYFLAAFFGVLCGLLIALVKPIFESMEGIIDFFRSIPVTTLYPLFVLFFGIGHLSKIGMVFWASFFVIALNSAYGVIQSQKTRRQMAFLFGANRFQVFRWVTFFNALPQTLIGLRVALSYSLIVEILCEMFMGSKYGLGQRVTEAYTTYAIQELYAIILLTGIFGYTFNRIFVKIENRLVPWVVS